MRGLRSPSFTSSESGSFMLLSISFLAVRSRSRSAGHKAPPERSVHRRRQHAVAQHARVLFTVDQEFDGVVAAAPPTALNAVLGQFVGPIAGVDAVKRAFRFAGDVVAGARRIEIVLNAGDVGADELSATTILSTSSRAWPKRFLLMTTTAGDRPRIRQRLPPDRPAASSPRRNRRDLCPVLP